MPLRDPPDRALALAATVGTLRDHWIETRCCRMVAIPLRLVASSGHGSRTLADVVVRLRCTACGKPPVSVELVEDEARYGAAAYGGRPLWRVRLIGEELPSDGPVRQP